MNNCRTAPHCTALHCIIYNQWTCKLTGGPNDTLGGFLESPTTKKFFLKWLNHEVFHRSCVAWCAVSHAVLYSPPCCDVLPPVLCHAALCGGWGKLHCGPVDSVQIAQKTQMFGPMLTHEYKHWKDLTDKALHLGDPDSFA